MWGGENKKSRVRWEIMTIHPNEEGTGIKDPIAILYAAKINMLKKLITRDRQPWMRWTERKVIKIEDRWETEEAMA